MNGNTDILRQYECAFRDLITQKNLNTDQNVKESLRLNKGEDWSFICTALDVIGDTTLAIANFLDFGLEGSSDGSNVGEKYLRLYGVLNACYLQQEAIGVLYQKTINPNCRKQEINSLFDDLKIRTVRNKVGSHSSDYNYGRESYVVIRNTLSKYSFQFMNNNNDEREWVDLSQCLQEQLILIIDLLDKVYEKSIKTLHEGEESDFKIHMQKLSELRRLKEALN